MINLLGGSDGKNFFYEGVILPNGDIKTNWQLTPFMNLVVVTNYIFGFVLIFFGSDTAIADCVESLSGGQCPPYIQGKIEPRKLLERESYFASHEPNPT